MSTYYVATARLSEPQHGPYLGLLVLDELPDDIHQFEVIWRVDNVTFGDEATAAILTAMADRYIYRAEVTRIVPRERTNDEKLQAARDALRADYWDDVRSVVDDIKDEIEKGELTDSDAVTEYLEERIDSQHRVIYTYAAMETVIFSDNDGAYEMHFGSEGLVEDGQVQWSRLAFYAMLEDVRGLLGDVEELIVEHALICYLCDVAFTDDDETEIAEYGGRQQRTHVTCPEDEEEED